MNLPLKLVCAIVLLQWNVTSIAAMPDTIRNNISDFDYLTRYTEDNLATYPAIERMYGKEYARLKKRIRKRIKKGEDIETATCDYVFWFFSQFDTHFIVSSHKFWNEYDTRVHANYGRLIDYQPQPVAQTVDSLTYLIRVPSCEGVNPSFAWVDSVTAVFSKSGCRNLIIDIRGNTGGNDAIWNPLVNLLADHTPSKPWKILFRNTEQNRELKKEMTDLVKRGSKDSRLFIPISDNEDEEQLPPSFNSPAKVAVVVDSRTASSAETFVRFIKDYCSRGIIYGHDNTSGANLSGNVAPFRLPHSGITCYYPTCVDATFPQHLEKRQLGIKPDVTIMIPLPPSLNDNVDSWVVWVADDLKQR